MSGKIPGIPLCHKWPSGPQCHHDLGHLSVLAPAAAFGGQPLIRHHFAARGSPFRLGQHAGFFHPAGRPPGCPWPPHHWARTAGPARFRIRNPFTVRAVAGSRPAGYAAGRRGEGWKKRRARRESRNFRNTASDWRSRGGRGRVGEGGQGQGDAAYAVIRTSSIDQPICLIFSASSG